MTGVFVALTLWLFSAGSGYAQTPHRAGLVIVHGDGSVLSRCVEFDGESISGYELLERSGLELRMEVSGMGPTICAVDQEGCGAGEHCFCRCLSSPCEYWSYWRLEDDGWRYASVGAGNTQVSDGMVEAWVWSEGSMQKGTAPQPPDLTLDAICQAQPAAAPAPRAGAPNNTPDSAPNNTPGRLAGPVGLLLVIGAPLLAAAGWWVARQGRKAPQGERHEQ